MFAWRTGVCLTAVYVSEEQHKTINHCLSSPPQCGLTAVLKFTLKRARCGDFAAFDPTEGPQSVAAAKCLRVLALIDDTSLGVKQAYTNSLRG